MKITAKHYDKEISVQVEREDLTFSEFMELLEQLSWGVGYSPELWDDYFKE